MGCWGLQECVKACSPLAPSREGSNLVTSPIVRIAPVALAVALLIPLGARAQDSECVSCHTARYASFSSDERAHFDDWRESIHAAAGVGCTACHEGNSEAETRAEAHDGVLGSSPPASPVHARNIPATCGACHTEQRLSFETSRHHQRLLDAVEGGAQLFDLPWSSVGRVSGDPRRRERVCVLPRAGPLRSDVGVPHAGPSHAGARRNGPA